MSATWQEQRMILDILSTDSSSTSIHVHKSYISDISIIDVMDNDVINIVCMNMINVKTLHPLQGKRAHYRASELIA